MASEPMSDERLEWLRKLGNEYEIDECLDEIHRLRAENAQLRQTNETVRGESNGTNPDYVTWEQEEK